MWELGLSKPLKLARIRTRGHSNHGLTGIQLVFEGEIKSPIFDATGSKETKERPFKDYDVRGKEFSAVQARVFQSTFVYKLGLVETTKTMAEGAADFDITPEWSISGVLERREIPPNHSIVGMFGMIRNPKGSPRRITSFSFILVDNSRFN